MTTSATTTHCGGLPGKCHSPLVAPGLRDLFRSELIRKNHLFSISLTRIISESITSVEQPTKAVELAPLSPALLHIVTFQADGTADSYGSCAGCSDPKPKRGPAPGQHYLPLCFYTDGHGQACWAPDSSVGQSITIV